MEPSWSDEFISVICYLLFYVHVITRIRRFLRVTIVKCQHLIPNWCWLFCLLHILRPLLHWGTNCITSLQKLWNVPAHTFYTKIPSDKDSHAIWSPAKSSATAIRLLVFLSAAPLHALILQIAATALLHLLHMLQFWTEDNCLTIYLFWKLKITTFWELIIKFEKNSIIIFIYKVWAGTFQSFCKYPLRSFLECI